MAVSGLTGPPLKATFVRPPRRFSRLILYALLFLPGVGWCQGVPGAVDCLQSTFRGLLHRAKATVSEAVRCLDFRSIHARDRRWRRRSDRGPRTRWRPGN